MGRRRKRDDEKGGYDVEDDGGGWKSEVGVEGEERDVKGRRVRRVA